MLTDGLYRDKDGQTASVRLTVTGYLIRYGDGRTIAVPTHPISARGHTGPGQPPSASAPGLIT